MNLNIRLSKYKPKLGEEVVESADYDDDELAPVMPAIDAVQLILEQEAKNDKSSMSNGKSRPDRENTDAPKPGTSKQFEETKSSIATKNEKPHIERSRSIRATSSNIKSKSVKHCSTSKSILGDMNRKNSTSNHINDTNDDDESLLVRDNPFENYSIPFSQSNRQEEYEFIPKSVILDVYSNDPEVKRFLMQLAKIPHESGLNEQDYKCYSCRRPIGLVFGQSRLCNFDGHHYCSECHLEEKSVIPSRIICNWDFSKLSVSKRNQHFLTLISNESMFELRKIAPLLYKMCPELREIEELRRQAFFVRSYCTTCVQDSISFELTKLIWPREHLIKQTDIYSLEDLVQIKNGNLKQVLKSVIIFGKQHVLSCVLCCQKGFICELCKSSQIIYPFDTESVYRCNECQSIYHKTCFKSKPTEDACPRCQRLKARRDDC